MESSTATGERPLILVTGSSGLIGRRVVEDLAHDYRVVGMDIEEPGWLVPNAAFIACDLTDDASVDAALARLVDAHGVHLASVVHLAGHYDFSGEPSPLYEQLTVAGTRRLLRGLAWLEVEQFIFSSTILVMRSAELGERITEDSPLAGEWDYPWSKIEAEAVIGSERGRIPALILRLAGVYDEWSHSPSITQQIVRIYESSLGSHLRTGDAQRGQPSLHLDDAAAVIRRAIERRFMLSDFEVMLVAEPEFPSYAELQDRLGQLIHGKQRWTTLRVPTSLAKAGAWAREKFSIEEPLLKPWMIDLADTHLPISSGRVEERLGWTPTHRLDSTLATMVEHLLEDPDRFYRENQLSRPENRWIVNR